MNKNKTKYVVVFIFMLIAGMSVAVAANVNDTSEPTHRLTKETAQQTDTNVITTKDVKNEPQMKEITKNKDSKTKEKTRGTIHNLSMSTYNSIFNTDGTLSSIVHCGDTINFIEDIEFDKEVDEPTHMIINKAVNIEGNDYTLNLDTFSGFGSYKYLSYFKVVNTGSFTNITNLHFHNSQIYVNCSNNVTFDHVNITVANQEVGQGVGVVSFCNGTANTTLKNSYMNISNNGGFSAMVLSIAENCTIENNTIIGEASVGNLLNLNVFGTTTNNPNGVTKNTRNKLINNNITGPSTASSITYAISISGPYNEIINNTVNYGGYGITTRWAGSYDEVTNTTDDEHDISYYGNIYENNKLLNGAKFSAGYYSIIKNNTISGTSSIADYSNVTNNTFNGAVTINSNTTFHENDASAITVTVSGAYCHIKDSNISTLYLSSNANPTYNCTGNNIGSVTGNPNYLVTCTGGGRTQQIQTLLKKTDTSAKSEGEEKVAVFRVTQENYASVGSNNLRYLFRDYPELNNYDTIIINITYWEKSIIAIHKSTAPSSPKHIILTYTENLFDKKLTAISTDLFTITVENVTVNAITEDQTNICVTNSVQTVTLRNCVFNASTDEVIRPSYFATSNPGVVIFDNCTITTGAYSFIAPTQGTLAGFLKGIEIKNSNIEINCEEQAYDYFFDYGVPKDNYDTNPSNIQSINITNNNITIKGMNGIKVVTNATTLIENNTITTDADYAIEITGNENIVRNNTLIAKTLQGNDAVLVTGTDNIVENNGPVEVKESEVNVTTENLEVGETTSLTAVFYTDNNEQIMEGIAIFKINGKTLRDKDGKVIYVEITDGKATSPELNITQEWTKEETTIQAVYTGNDNTQPISTTPTTISITKPEANIIITAPTTANPGAVITLKATVSDGDKAVTSGRVTFKLNGKTLKDSDGKTLYANVENGEATISYTIPEKTKAKEYVLKAVFTDTIYDRQETTSTLTVVKA